MISKLCSVDKGAFIMLKRFLPSTLSHYNGYFELRQSFTLSLSISSARNLWCFSWASCEIARECSCFHEKSICLKPWAAVSRCPVAFPLRTSLGLWHFHCQCLFLPNPGFYKGWTPHFCFSMKVIHFFMLKLLTESVIQQKWWNKMIVTYNTFKLWTKYFPQCHNIKG